MEENIELPEDLELPEVEDTAWRERAIDIGRNFCMVYGALALVRDVARFVCRN